MAFISQNVPNLIQGVSQQPAALDTTPGTKAGQRLRHSCGWLDEEAAY